MSNALTNPCPAIRPPTARPPTTRPPTTRAWTQADPNCRLCGTRLSRTLLDLGHVPLANRTLAPEATHDEPYHLQALICDSCTLVQVADVAAPETIATPVPYLSSRSPNALHQARRLAETLRKRFRLTPESFVIEVGSNDGYLLRQFQAAAIPVLGIEPAPHAAAAALELGIATEIAWFNTETAMEVAVRHGRADLVIANNVLSLVPDLFDFAAGLANILRPNGVLTLQVPHLLSLIQKAQFDAFRHDRYSYLSLRVLEHMLRSVSLRVFDAERLPDHGGSLRIYACHAVGPHAARPGLKSVRLAEAYAQYGNRDIFTGFTERVAAAREEIVDFVRTRRAAGRRVAAYGAAPRGTTLLHCCGITPQDICYVADPDPAKHGRVLPGSRIPIVPLETLHAEPPDDILVLPWPNAAEIAAGLTHLRQQGTQLWTTVPRIMRLER